MPIKKDEILLYKELIDRKSLTIKRINEIENDLELNDKICEIIYNEINKVKELGLNFVNLFSIKMSNNELKYFTFFFDKISNITKINIYDNNIGDDGIIEFSKKLIKIPELSQLYLWGIIIILKKVIIYQMMD